jgi:hypothetical protein
LSDRTDWESQWDEVFLVLLLDPHKHIRERKSSFMFLRVSMGRMLVAGIDLPSFIGSNDSREILHELPETEPVDRETEKSLASLRSWN